MPEIKNTFLKSKMNKDLDSRIIPNGEYRDAKNVSVSTSEGADVGALENILGNIEVADFGLTDLNLEIIGHCTDVSSNRIFFFITNYTDASVGISTNLSVPDASFSDATSNWTRTGSANYICYAQISGDAIDVNVTNVSSGILVAGTFLNFSKTHPILGVNVLEDLLFWTDDRNQPRKINIERALGNPYISATNPGYYTHEDHISVAKYAPYTSINFLKEVNVGGEKETTLINEVDEWLPAIVMAPGQVKDPGGSIDDYLRFSSDVGGQKLQDYLGDALSFDIRVTVKDSNSYAYINNFENDNDVYLKSSPTSTSIIEDIPSTLGWDVGNQTFLFSNRNPNYRSDFTGDVDLLKDKFVRFSYRFKYDDGEYSLTAPFSQHAFIPKQFGYFIGDDDIKTAESSTVDFMENQVTSAGLMIDLPCSPSDLVDTLHISELQILYKASDEQSLKVVADIDNDGLKQGLASELTVLPGPTDGGTGFDVATFVNTQGGSGTGLRVNIQSVTGPSDSISSIKVITHGEGYRLGDIITIPSPATNGETARFKITKLESKYLYNYTSQNSIKVLPEKEIVRVSDIVPLRAKTQEVVGNRVIYGNFLQNNETPNSLNYKVQQTTKGSSQSLKINEELLNHTLKQNRTYQAGIVLQDRYGRSSNVIINNSNSKLTEFNSTHFSPYTNGGIDTLSWPGNSLNIIFDEKIPATRTSTYNGIWIDEENPTGWYTYKVVVKQQEQDYYNIYVPGSLSGNVVYNPMYLETPASGSTPDKYIPRITYTSENGIGHIALFNDNINKIPRDLKEVGPSDSVYSSSTVLYSIVNNRTVNVEAGALDISEQSLIISRDEVTSIKPFSEFGEWVKYKGVDLHYLNMDPDPNVVPRSQYYGTSSFAYPGSKGNVDPFFLDNNKNPLIATVKTKSRFGATATQQSFEAPAFKFAKKLTIFETKPVKSEIDIYYETSSSGTIQEFNKQVDLDANLQSINGLSVVNSVMFESDQIGTSEIVSSQFQAVDFSGVPVADSSITMSIEEVYDLRGRPVSNYPFEITEVNQGSGTAIQPTFAFYRTKEQVFYSDSLRVDKWTVKVKIQSNVFSTFISDPVSLVLSNKKPEINKISQSFSEPSSGFLFYENWSGLSFFPTGDFDTDQFEMKVIEKKSYNESGRFSVGYFYSTTNGSSYDFSQTDWYYRFDFNTPSINKLTDLVYEISQVRQWSCDFNTSTQFVDQIGVKQNNTYYDKTNDFKIVNARIVSSGQTLSAFRILHDKRSDYEDGDFNKVSNSTQKKGGLLFDIYLKLKDAGGSGGGGALTSDEFIIRYLIVKSLT